MIYFDHNATTPVDPLVVEAMMPFLTNFYGNPSSLHRHGRAVKTSIEQAREQVARLVNVSPEQVIFTSGGTEANNLAILGIANHRHALFGKTEHPSVAEPMACLNALGAKTEAISVDKNGLISADCLNEKLTDDTGFISIMYANNETGVIQDVPQLTELTKTKGITFHTDAVQAVGKMAVDFPSSGVNLMTLSAHKLYGPKGVGALIHDNKTELTPIITGGGQEGRYRPGTENVAAIIGFGKAAQLAVQQLEERHQHLHTLRAALEQGVQDISGLSIAAQEVGRIPNTTQILMDNIDGEMLLMQLDQKSICVSSGSACSSNSKEPSPVLTAMGYPRKLALSAIRVSLGQQNTLGEVAEFIAVLKAIVSR